MRGVTKLEKLHMDGYNYLAVSQSGWEAKVFVQIPDIKDGIWYSDDDYKLISLKCGEILALQKHNNLKQPFPIGEAITILKWYEQNEESHEVD